MIPSRGRHTDMSCVSEQTDVLLVVVGALAGISRSPSVVRTYDLMIAYRECSPVSISSVRCSYHILGYWTY